MCDKITCSVIPKNAASVSSRGQLIDCGLILLFDETLVGKTVLSRLVRLIARIEFVPPHANLKHKRRRWRLRAELLADYFIPRRYCLADRLYVMYVVIPISKKVREPFRFEQPVLVIQHRRHVIITLV